MQELCEDFWVIVDDTDRVASFILPNFDAAGRVHSLTGRGTLAPRILSDI